jgi:hypothetical protein
MRKYFIYAAAPFVLSLLIGAGEVYRWKDPNGIWHYSDQPQPGAELVKSARLPSATPGGSSPSPPPPPAAREDGPPPPLPALTPQVASQVRQEAASAKAEQCKKAETGYQQAVQARRMYKTDDKGNRVFLNEAELDAARLQARSARDLACAP